LADQEPVHLLRRGVKEWNAWRCANPDSTPDLSGADLRGAHLSAADLTGVRLNGADLTGGDLVNAYLAGADLCGAWLRWADLFFGNLRGAKLSIADLRGAILRGACVEGADLSGARLGGADLRDSDLSRADLSGADLNRADLSRAKLTEADLTEANLGGVDLTEANLSRAKLAGARLSGAKLSRADIRQTDLSGADFRGADLNGPLVDAADMARAYVGGTIFADIDLRGIKGLESVHHRGPSSIASDTIYKSGGQIPEIFLRGCGVPDSFIAYARSLVGIAIDYYSCFISYSSKDDDFAQRLYADLQAKGVRCWFAPEDLKIGDKLRPRIDESIRLHDKLLLVLSETSVSSQWVEQEVETALAREREGKTVLFPVRLDDAVMKSNAGWPALIKNARHIGDFQRWKDHGAYQKAFDRLLRDLQADKVS
jgi:uncharacterized protein YjbI with pentapeptide repeats